MFSLTRNWVVDWGSKFEPVTDFPPRPCRTFRRTFRQSVTACLGLSAIRCVRGGKRETAIVKKSSVSFHLKSCDHSVRDARDPRRCPSTCIRRALGKKRRGSGQKVHFGGQKAKFAGQKKFINQIMHKMHKMQTIHNMQNIHPNKP